MASLPTRRIAALTVSNIGLGCMSLHHAYGPGPSEEDCIKLLCHALDSGVIFFDTAALYGGGRNEEVVGKALMHRRSEFILASKCVLEVRDGKRMLDARPEAIRRTLEDSLRRLGTDHIDLYYLHRPDPAVPIEDSVGELTRAVEAGKIGAIGLSEMDAPTLRRAHAVHPITAMQTEYSPWVRNPEVAVLPACRELGIGFVAFSPVARGFLADAIHDANFAEGDYRLMMPRFQEPNLSRNLDLLDRFRAVAQKHGITPAQLSLAWILAQGDFIVPIPGTRIPAHLDENIGAATVQLSAEAVAEVDAIFTPGAVAGRRYPPQLQASVGTELLPEELD